jgi:hypothetical protein
MAEGGAISVISMFWHGKKIVSQATSPVGLCTLVRYAIPIIRFWGAIS